MYIDSYKSSLHGEVDVVLMGVTSVVEPACAAISEAAAIVEAEWMRLRRPSLPVRYPNCELPAARAARPRTTILVYTMPTRVMCSTSPRATTGRWPVSLVWARQRSPPLRQRLSQSGERRQLRKTKYGLSKNGVASVPSTNIATHCSRDAHLRAHSHVSWSSTWTA
ncbi:hypothetical protein [Mycobacterium arosiense]|uniref:Uncharacterized protein n=1 Tax=Mycobacterium arosiense ATCC BAA-1401 = DSM 45069 TaxID=1265311 RepID=A0A1W9ZCD9_MYCAI|nr:hypothetical protein [Mycobacterium arosiense]ORA11550.1 hypothetical protein BST14_18435 [Mycobacterium arosiense ATCC BAA-1401 = DSM 45069]